MSCDIGSSASAAEVVALRYELYQPFQQQMEVNGHHPRAAFPAAFSRGFGDAPCTFGGAGPNEYVEAVAERVTEHRTGAQDAVRAAAYHPSLQAARLSENCAEVSEQRMSDDDLYGADGDDVISACLTSSEDEGDQREDGESDDDDDSDAEGGENRSGAPWAGLAQLMPHSAPCLSSFDAADMYGEGAEEHAADALDGVSALQGRGGGNGISSSSRREFNRTGSAGYRPALRASQMSAAAAAAAADSAASASAATRSPPQYLPFGAAAASVSPQRLTTTSPSSFSPTAPANTPNAAPPSLSHSPKRYNSPASSSAYSLSPSRHPHPPTGSALQCSQPSLVSPYRSSSPVCPPATRTASAAGASRSPPPHSSGHSPQGQSSSLQPFAHSPTYPDHSPSGLNQTPHGSGYSVRSAGHGAPGRSSSPSPGANGCFAGPAPSTAGGRSFASGDTMERRRSSAERSEHPYRRQQSEPAVRALAPTQGQSPAAAAAAAAVAPAPCERVPRSFSSSSRSSAGEPTAHRPRHSISESMKNAARAAVQAASVASQNNSHEQQQQSQARQSNGAAFGRSRTMTERSHVASRSTPGLEGRPKRIVAAAAPAAAAASAVAAAAPAGPPPMQRKSRSLTRTDGAELSLKHKPQQAEEAAPVSPPQAVLTRVPTTKRRGKDIKLNPGASAGEGAGEIEGKPLQRTRSGSKAVLVFEIPDPEPVRDLEEKPSKGTGSLSSSSSSSSRGMRSGSAAATSAAAVPTPAPRSTVQADSCSAGGGDSAAASSQGRSTSKPKILKGILKSSKSQKDDGGRAARSEPGAVAVSSKPRAKSAGVKRVYV